MDRIDKMDTRPKILGESIEVKKIIFQYKIFLDCLQNMLFKNPSSSRLRKLRQTKISEKNV